MKSQIVVAGFVLNDNDDILMIKRVSPPWEGYWIVPGGHVEESENPQEALVREIKEETGLDVSLIDFHDEDMKNLKEIEEGIRRLPQPFLVQEEISGHGDHKHINLVYICRYNNSSPIPSENMEVRWMSVSEMEKAKIPYNVKLWARKILEKIK